MDLDEGATRDRDPEKIAVSGALCACSGAACRARGERKSWGQRVSEREREGEGIGRPIGRGFGRAGALGQAGAVGWLGRLAPGCWAGWPGQLGGFLFFFFELEGKKNIEKYIYIIFI